MTSRKRASRKDNQQAQQPEVGQSLLPKEWWEENQEVFQHLYEGRRVKEIAHLTGRSLGEVKAVKKQLDDLRTAKLSLPDILNLLEFLPHPRVERPPEVIAAFERLIDQIEQEEPDESEPVMRDASSEHDKYIYGN